MEIEELDWNREHLQEAKNMLEKTKNNPPTFKKTKINVQFHKNSILELENCIKYWSEKLNES